ncbi:hypothetical protein KGQ20_18815 [Catenulispora sp. NF23]|uniref:Uncharacterized protein n=1 Tax=Catenulispora pinistramenti TaxID=2705254 RepID=A0ABS5KXK7_9ACTN|nr:hypothetical protein [Catenulispora pinistramenti]MBS2534826.1 hypothetical protein [Catenulispora pinistramenti]MBS2550709.1 hypothetical protein [Catenulispora pinistramenti]
MHKGKLGLGTALVAGMAVTGALVLAPAASAVSPDSATLSFDCGSFGSGSATLAATQDGTSATITVSTAAITSPINVGADSVNSTLVMSDASGATVSFTGSSNPAITAGQPISTGPLTGTVTSGDALSGQSMTIVVFGITATCTATSAQSPGPFQF